MAENWIEEAVEEIYNLAMSMSTELNNVQEKRAYADIILSHAPVIDALAIAEKLWVAGLTELTVESHKEQDSLSTSAKSIIKGELKRIANVITSNLELSITWVDGQAEWGEFNLYVCPSGGKFSWLLDAGGDDTFSKGEADTQELAEAACVDALKRIVCGVKDVG